ncbi:hypothetical protein RFM98_13685 [Mesorhizobium sp. VK9D]|uniref:hypothetical protein n=1 Tax=Mesorhizobium australafricanum TaxID=3072311 RepID=UPI002A239FE7|nr:hypothetical protein [Mesorhizobium sp. VK9D]MDX8453811.1 hypothetical protein [Mesorhizobium sp. VK9D]
MAVAEKGSTIRKSKEAGFAGFLQAGLHEFAGEIPTPNVKTLRRINAFVPKLHRQNVGPEGVPRSNCHDLHTNNRQMQAHWGLMN